MEKLTNKDKHLIDYLFDYCRYTTKQLSRALNIPQQTVSYKIKRLEERGFISRYDAILNWDNIPLIKKIYLFNTKTPEKIIEKIKDEKPVHSFHENIGIYNLAVWCFFKTKKQMKEFEKMLPKKRLEMPVNNVIASDFSHFGTQIKLKKPTIKQKQLNLDEKDVKIMKHLSSGHARDSLLKISKDLRLNYNTIHYRLKRLIKNGYFSRLMPQIGEKFGGLQVTLAIFRFENTDQDILRKIENLDFMVLGGYSKRFLYLHIISTNREDYLKKLGSIYQTMRNKDIKESIILDWKKLHLANRYPLEFLI